METTRYDSNRALVEGASRICPHVAWN